MNALDELEYLDPLDSMVELGKKLISISQPNPVRLKYTTLMSENTNLLIKLNKMEAEYTQLKTIKEIESYKSQMQSIKNQIEKNIAFLKILANTLL